MGNKENSPDFLSADAVVTSTVVGKPDFDWDDTIQGHLLSAYAFGYILGNLSGGTLCSLFGGKKYMAAAMTLQGILQLLSPVAATQSHWFLWCLRFLFGAAVSLNCIKVARRFPIILIKYLQFHFRGECSVLEMH